VQLILAHAQLADDAAAFGSDVVELIVESIDAKTTRRILRSMAGDENQQTKTNAKLQRR